MYHVYDQRILCCRGHAFCFRVHLNGGCETNVFKQYMIFMLYFRPIHRDSDHIVFEVNQSNESQSLF